MVNNNHIILVGSVNAASKEVVRGAVVVSGEMETVGRDGEITLHSFMAFGEKGERLLSAVGGKAYIEGRIHWNRDRTVAVVPHKVRTF
jgi:hypothetical protein